MPFDARTDFIRVTDETVLTPITVQIANSDLQFQNKEGVMHGVLDVFGEITSLGGHIVNTFEKSLVLDVPEHEFQQYQNHKSLYQEAIPLRPGRYKLSLVLKDDLNGHMGSEELGIRVPNFSEDKLTNSSLILADQIQPLPTSQVGTGHFVIGGTKVRPSVNNMFTRDQRLGIYMQVYNLGIDDKTHKPSLDVRYEVDEGWEAAARPAGGRREFEEGLAAVHGGQDDGPPRAHPGEIYGADQSHRQHQETNC